MSQQVSFTSLFGDALDAYVTLETSKAQAEAAAAQAALEARADQPAPDRQPDMADGFLTAVSNNQGALLMVFGAMLVVGLVLRK